MSVKVYSLLVQAEEERMQEGEPYNEIIPKSTWLLKKMKKVPPFLKLKIITRLNAVCQPPLQISTTGHGVLKFVDKFQDLSKGEGLRST